MQKTVHARLSQEHGSASSSERNLRKSCAFVFDKHRVLHYAMHKIRIKNGKKIHCALGQRCKCIKFVFEEGLSDMDIIRRKI